MNKPSYEELERQIKRLERIEIMHNKTEEALRESEERFRRLSEATFEGIVIHEKGLILVNETSKIKMGDIDIVASFLEALSDGEWHDVVFLGKKFSLDKLKLDKIIGFYKHFGFIEEGASSDAVRIDKLLSELYLV